MGEEDKLAAGILAQNKTDGLHMWCAVRRLDMVVDGYNSL